MRSHSSLIDYYTSSLVEYYMRSHSSLVEYYMRSHSSLKSVRVHFAPGSNGRSFPFECS